MDYQIYMYWFVSLLLLLLNPHSSYHKINVQQSVAIKKNERKSNLYFNLTISLLVGLTHRMRICPLETRKGTEITTYTRNGCLKSDYSTEKPSYTRNTRILLAFVKAGVSDHLIRSQESHISEVA